MEDTSKLSSRGSEATTMEEGENNSPHKWACSSLSSSDKFSSLYDKVLEGSLDWDRKNIESLVSSQNLQQSTLQPAVPKPRSKIIFPHIMTRGSVVGNKVHCKTSINNCFTWRQRSNSLYASSSMLLTNFYLERSSDIQSGISKIAEEPLPSDPEDNEKTEEHLVSKQCRTLLLSVAGAAGMQLLFPSLRLPLLEVLLFSHHKWPTRKTSPLSNRGGGWWRFPFNLTLAISRPFYGSVLRRSLTAVLFILQLRVRKKIGQRSARYMPDLYKPPLLEERNSVNRDLNPSAESLDCTTDTEVETLSWDSNSVSCSEDGENSVHVQELIRLENDCPDEVPASVDISQDVISDDGLSLSGESCEQDGIFNDRLSSSGDPSDQDVISGEEISSASNSSLKDSDLDDYNLGHLSDGTHPDHEAREQSILQPYGTTFSLRQPYDDSTVVSATETCSSVFTTETCSNSDISTSSVGSDPYSDVTSEENSEEPDFSSDVSTAWVESDSDTVDTGDEDSVETISTLYIFTFSAGSATDSLATRGEDSVESHFILDTSISLRESDPDSLATKGEDSEESHFILDTSISLAESDPDSVVIREEDSEESHSTVDSSTSFGGTDLDSVVSTENSEGTHSTLDASTSSAGIDPGLIVIPETDSEETHSNLVSSTSSAGSDMHSVKTPKEDSEEFGENHSLLIQQDREITADTSCVDLADEKRIPTPPQMESSESWFFTEQHSEIVENAVEDSAGDDEVLFPSSEEFQFHDDIPPSPGETRRQEFVRSSSGRFLDPCVPHSESTPGSSKSIQVSPRADLTALMPEELGCGAADGTWEIEVDGLEVVWTPFSKNRRVLVSEGDDSSNFSDDSTADDTDSCESTDGSQMGRDDELSDEDRMIVQNADHGTAEDCHQSNSVQERNFHNDCVESNQKLGVRFSSANRFPALNFGSSWLEDTRDEHECVPSVTGIPSDSEDARGDFEFQSAGGLRESKVANAEGLGAFEAERMEVTEASTPRVKLTVRLDGEELFDLRPVIPEHSHRSSGSPTENSLTRRQGILHNRESLAVEVLHTDDDFGVDVVRGTDSKDLSSLTVANSIPDELDRVPIVAHVHEEAIVESQLKRNKSLAVSVSSSSFLTAFSDDVANSPYTPSESTSALTDSHSEISDTSTSWSCTSGHFADHPTCLHLRKVRHSHSDQVYLELPELLSEPWCNLVYWHGRCREGRPTLVVLLGKAVRKLSAPELKHFITVTISHAEYAELNFFRGAVKQMNILMDLDGLGFMRLPPMHVLQSIGTILNRDYAGRGGWLFLVNAPIMLGLVISAVQRVILRPSYTKGAVIDKGFLEGKERIVTLGGRYKATLLNHFDEEMLPLTLGGTCAACRSETSQCHLGFDYLSR